MIENIKAISFDLDYTLWDLAGVLHRAEARLLDFLIEHYPRVGEHFDLETLHQLRFDIAAQRADISHNVTALRKAALSHIARTCGYDDSLVEPAFKVFIDARHEVLPYADALPLLEALRGRYTLGVLTNGNADVHRLGLGHHFDFVLSAMDIGAAKPERMVFEATCHRAGVAAAELLHVGDEPESDVFGAARYGAQAVWVNREAREWPPELERVVHAEVDSLAALGRLLGVAKA